MDEDDKPKLQPKAQARRRKSTKGKTKKGIAQMGASENMNKQTTREKQKSRKAMKQTGRRPRQTVQGQVMFDAGAEKSRRNTTTTYSRQASVQVVGKSLTELLQEENKAEGAVYGSGGGEGGGGGGGGGRSGGTSGERSSTRNNTSSGSTSMRMQYELDEHSSDEEEDTLDAEGRYAPITLPLDNTAGGGNSSRGVDADGSKQEGMELEDDEEREQGDDAMETEGKNRRGKAAPLLGSATEAQAKALRATASFSEYSYQDEDEGSNLPLHDSDGNMLPNGSMVLVQLPICLPLRASKDAKASARAIDRVRSTHSLSTTSASTAAGVARGDATTSSSSSSSSASSSSSSSSSGSTTTTTTTSTSSSSESSSSSSSSNNNTGMALENTNNTSASSLELQAVDAMTAIRTHPAECKPTISDSIPSGQFGTIRYYKSGKVQMIVGDVIFDFSEGTQTQCAEVASIIQPPPRGQTQGDLAVLGQIKQRVVVDLAMDDMLEKAMG